MAPATQVLRKANSNVQMMDPGMRARRKRIHLPAVVATQSNEHDAGLADFPLRLELHLGFDGCYRVALDNGRLVPTMCEK